MIGGMEVAWLLVVKKGCRCVPKVEDYHGQDAIHFHDWCKPEY